MSNELEHARKKEEKRIGAAAVLKGVLLLHPGDI